MQERWFGINLPVEGDLGYTLRTNENNFVNVF